MEGILSKIGKRLRVGNRGRNGRKSAAIMLACDEHVTTAPTPENAVRIFQNEWASQLPEACGQLPSGKAKLFDDERIHWLVEELGGIPGQSVLELGPLEAGHTYSLEKYGAGAITAIESNRRAYLKCLVMKEVLGLQKARFLCGDFVEYLKSNKTRFDLCVASGVLYHQTNPVETLELLSRSADRLFIWTHYYDESVIGQNDFLRTRFSETDSFTFAGLAHQLHRYEYGSDLNNRGFCGGQERFGCWLSREDLVAALNHFGFTDLRFAFEQPDHPHGPALAVLAMR